MNVKMIIEDYLSSVLSMLRVFFEKRYCAIRDVGIRKTLAENENPE